MNTKNIKTTKISTLMFLSAALIGTLGIGAHSAFADVIDFETGSELDEVGTVVTTTNEVTFKIDNSTVPTAFELLPDGILVNGSNADIYGFTGISGDLVTGQIGNMSLSNNYVPTLPIANAHLTAWTADDYVILFEYAVASLNLDVYDFGDFVQGAPGSITLEVYSDAAGTVKVGDDEVLANSLANNGNDSTINLSVTPMDALILSARVIDTQGDIGTAIDNIEFATALVKTASCTDTDTDTAIDVLIKKHNSTVTCDLIIDFNGEADETLSIHDTIPAEWKVNDVIGDGCGSEPSNKKGNNKSSTQIWCPSTSAPITIQVETRESPGNGHTKRGGDPAFKPTSCGIISLNDGALLLDDAIPPNVLASSAPLLLLVSEDGDNTSDCDGDGWTDAEEFAQGTDPAVFNDEDSDGVGDGDDLCPFDADQGLGWDEDGCAVPNPS
jgi:hypothetical protein